jgi:type III pantothenate kinase
MELNLCIDIGNSRIKMALMEDDIIRHFGIFEHQRVAEIEHWLAEQEFAKAIYSSVLLEEPQWLMDFRKNHEVIRLNIDLKLPFSIFYKTPESLGADRIAALTGAISLYPDHNILVVNAGSCITFDFINKKKEFHGGNISPGLDMRFRAMHEFTAALPRVTHIEHQSQIFGNTTFEALQKGAHQGLIFEIEGYYNLLKLQNPDLICVITGGSASFLVNQLKIDNFAEPYLVLKGLNTILKNQ